MQSTESTLENNPNLTITQPVEAAQPVPAVVITDHTPIRCRAGAISLGFYRVNGCKREL